jgi:hypothetical protein
MGRVASQFAAQDPVDRICDGEVHSMQSVEVTLWEQPVTNQRPDPTVVVG